MMLPTDPTSGWSIPHHHLIAIVGYGWVGKSMLAIFPDAVVFDEPLGIGSREEVNECEIALICVPTPSTSTGECDTSIVADVISWLDVQTICIKSAVSPGTTERLAKQYHKQIVVSPEFIGEGPTWDGTITDTWASEDSYSREELARRWPYVIAGGPITPAQIVLDAYEERLGDGVEYLHEEDTTTVELVKYMENVWLAMQVTWANEFHEIAGALGADYEAARDLWAYDPRVSAHHTDVLPERGFGGKCLPKDLLGIIWASRRAGYDPAFLQAIHYTNKRFRQMNQ